MTDEKCGGNVQMGMKHKLVYILELGWVANSVTRKGGRLKISDQSNMLENEDRLKIYWGVKDLLEMLLRLGKIEICSKYAILGTIPNLDEVGAIRQPSMKPCILEFTFAPAVQKAADHEKIFDSGHVQEPFVVWKYFETALYFWDIKESDIERELQSLSENNPLEALSTGKHGRKLLR